MATTTVRRKGSLTPIGELAGVTITRKMLKSGESKNKAVLEFLQFIAAVNGGGVR